ncbi:MAG: asparagine synthetase B [Vicinamibacterales bacterium]
MLARMRPYPWLQAEAVVRDADGVALGRVSHAGPAQCDLCVTADGRDLLAWEGEIYNLASERARLVDAGVRIDGTDAGEVLLRGWQVEGAAFLARLNGMFTFALWNGTAQTLTLATDRFGLRPLFYTCTPQAFVAATELKTLLSTPGVGRNWSEAGVAEFFAFGHFITDRTLIDGIRQVPPATYLTFSAGDRRLTTGTYWTPSLAPSQATPEEQVSLLDERMARAVEIRAREGERLGISLSGGLDSRTLLGLVPPGRNLRSVCLGIEGGIDHRSAAELARLVNVPHHAYVLDSRVLDNFEANLREMVGLTDGHYLDQGIVMPTMATYREQGIDFLLRGHGGELLHMKKAYSFSLDAAALAASAPELETWLQHHLTAYMLDGVPQDLFVFDVRPMAYRSLREALDQTPAGAQPIDSVWPLVLSARLHRETSLSVQMFGYFAAVRMPFLDNDVIDSLFAMPASMKLGADLQIEILRRRKPEFVDVVNANTGARMGAGPLETNLAYARMRIAAKLGFKGYQPYERLGLWLRRELKPMVDRVLLSDTFLQRGLFRADAVRRVVSEHYTGANHTFLLMSLICFELGQQMLDEQGRVTP